MKHSAPLAALLLTLTLTGCGGGKVSVPDSSTAESQASDTENSLLTDEDGNQHLTLSNGKNYLITDEGSIVETVSDGLKWRYLGGTCKMTFPLEWEDRFVIRETAVYAKACYAVEEGTGELFRIEFVPYTDLLKKDYRALIGTLATNDLFAAISCPEAPQFAPDDDALSEEYQSMAAQLPDVFASASCIASKEFQPIDLTDLSPATEDAPFAGCWMEDPTNDMTPYMVFRSRDSAFGYRNADAPLLMGIFLAGKDNHGIAISAKQICRLTITDGETRIMDVQPLLNPSGETFGPLTLQYDRDYQEIYDVNSDGTEAELPQ